MSSSSDASSYSTEEEEEEVPPPIKKPAVESSEEEEEEVRPPPKKPAAKSTAAPPPKPTAAAASEAQTPKSKPLSKPSIPDSSSDEEEDEEESESDSDTDEKATKTQQPPPPKPAATLAAAAAPSADSGSTTDGSDSSDSESSDQPAPPRHSLRVAEPAIKPLASKPMDGTPVKDADKKKKAKAPEPVATEEGSTMHKRPFQRIWSEDDEIVLLRGLADYHAKKCIVPSSATDMEAFHNIVQKSLAVTVNKGQLFNKIRALKKKHENAAARRSKGGAPAEFKPRDEAAWELSKQIWGNGGNGGKSGKVKPEKNREKMNRKERSVVSSEDEDEGGLAEDGNDSSSHPLLKKAILHTGSRKRRAVLAEESMQMLGDSKARELERKYKKLAIEEMKMDELRMELLMESLKLFRDALAKSG